MGYSKPFIGGFNQNFFASQEKPTSERREKTMRCVLSHHTHDY